MAGRLLRIGTDADVPIANNKTILQILPATNFGLRYKSFWFGLRGTSVTDQPVVIQVRRASADGTGTINNPTKKAGPGARQATGFRNFTVEPATKGDVLWGPEALHPQGSLIHNFRFDDEIVVEQSETNPTVIVEVVDASGLTTGCRAGLTCEE